VVSLKIGGEGDLLIQVGPSEIQELAFPEGERLAIWNSTENMTGVSQDRLLPR
jgi:hypothetical protein